MFIEQRGFQVFSPVRAAYSWLSWADVFFCLNRGLHGLHGLHGF